MLSVEIVYILNNFKRKLLMRNATDSSILGGLGNFNVILIMLI